MGVYLFILEVPTRGTSLSPFNCTARRRLLREFRSNFRFPRLSKICIFFTHRLFDKYNSVFLVGDREAILLELSTRWMCSFR